MCHMRGPEAEGGVGSEREQRTGVTQAGIRGRGWAMGGAGRRATYSYFISLVGRLLSGPVRRFVAAAPLRPSSTLVSGHEDDIGFDQSALPPFTIGDVRAAIPKHCWVKSSWRSMTFVLIDVVGVVSLAAAALYFNSWVVWPFYWFVQELCFGHFLSLDTTGGGHGSFSDNQKLNSVIGHLFHSFILVPYNGWYINLQKEGSHFDPNSDLFVPSEREDVLISTLCCSEMVSLLLGLAIVMGPMWILKLYAVPYWTFVIWLDLVTYLHHHGHEKKIPWYRGKTEAAKPMLGKYYREPKKSSVFPIELIKPLVKSMAQDHYVKDDGDIVFYQSDAGPHSLK
eukprot:Gb_32149 [translate_table: standard]